MFCKEGSFRNVSKPLGLFLLISGFLFSGCTTVSLQTNRPVSLQITQDILLALQEKESRILSLKGLFRASITGSLLPISKTIPGVVFYHKPDSIRLKGLTPVGGTFFQFLQDGDDYQLMLPVSGQFTSGKIKEVGQNGDMGNVVELSLRAMDTVLGKIRGLDPKTVRLYEEEHEIRLDIPESGGGKDIMNDVFLTRIWVEKQRKDIVRVQYYDQNGDVLRSIACQDFRDISKVKGASGMEREVYLPFHIRAEDERLSGSVTLDFQELVAKVEAS